MDARTTRYSPDISRTAIALLALLAEGKPLSAATIRSLLEGHLGAESSLNLTIFSDENDDAEEGHEPPVIIPFTIPLSRQNRESCSLSNGYGTLAMQKERVPYLRIFSPDSTDDDADDEPCYAMSAISSPMLRVYEG